MSRAQMRLLTEFSLPNVAVGVFAALGAGGLAAFAGQPAGWAVVTGLGLGVPLALFGVGYGVLIALQKVPSGVFTPAAGYWLVGFPLAMLMHASVTEWLFTGAPGLPQEPLWQFLAYHALLSMGFAIGFLWVHEQLGRRWWPRIRDHNPYAYQVVEQYKESATVLHERELAAKESRRRKRGRGAKATTRARGAKATING